MNKKLFFFFLMLFATFQCFSQDLIVQKDGSIIKSVVQEITQNEIIYVKWSNKKGPKYHIDKSSVLSIEYQNGEVEKFSVQQISENNRGVGLISVPANLDNDAIIERYNHPLSLKGKWADKINNNHAKRKKYNKYALKWGVTSYSVMSNKDLTISIELTRFNGVNPYGIYIYNKTDHVIFIDRGNCFKTRSDRKDVRIYYDGTEQFSVSNGSGSGASLNLGSVAGVLGIGGAIGTLATGINVGGGSHSGSSTTYTPARVIAIPPQSSRLLSENKYIKIKENKYQEVEKAELFDVDNLYPKNTLNEPMFFSEQSSPVVFDWYITYSNKENFSSYSTMHFATFIQQIINCDYYYRATIYWPRYYFDDNGTKFIGEYPYVADDILCPGNFMKKDFDYNPNTTAFPIMGGGECTKK